LSANLSAQDRVVELLRTLHEAEIDRDPPGGESGLLGIELMSSMWNEGSYQELEDRLTELREQQRQLWWHVCYRYRFGETRMMLALVNRKRGGDTFHLPKRTELVAGGPSVGSRHALCRVYQWSEQVRPELVTEGVDVLTASMYDGREDRIWLPAVVYDRLMGRLLKVAA
jgi:hypothetical protein